MDRATINCEPLKKTRTKSTNTTQKSKRNKKPIKAYKSLNKKNFFKDKYYSNKNNCIYNFDKMPIKKKNIKSDNNLTLFSNTNYKKNLYEIYSLFLGKNKFFLSNNFNKKNSKKFLEKKDKCLERIILPDLKEDNCLNDNYINSKKDYRKPRYSTQKNINKYFIVITNYDDEQKNKNSLNNCSIHTTKTSK